MASQPSHPPSPVGDSDGSAGRGPTTSSPTSGPASPSSPRQPSYQQHRPNQPSQLRLSHMPSTSPEDRRAQSGLEADGIHPHDHEPAAVADTDATHQQGLIEGVEEGPNAATALLERANKDGDYTIRPRQGRGYGSFASTYAETVNSFDQNRPSLGGRYNTADDVDTRPNSALEALPDSVTEGLLGKSKARGTTSWLRRRAGIKKKRLMCVSSYFPFKSLSSRQRLMLYRADRLVGTFIITFLLPIGYGSTDGAF